MADPREDLLFVKDKHENEAHEEMRPYTEQETNEAAQNEMGTAGPKPDEAAQNEMGTAGPKPDAAAQNEMGAAGPKADEELQAEQKQDKRNEIPTVQVSMAPEVSNTVVTPGLEAGDETKPEAGTREETESTSRIGHEDIRMTDEIKSAEMEETGLVMVEVGTDDQDGKKEKVPRSKRDKKHALKQGIAKAELEPDALETEYSDSGMFRNDENRTASEQDDIGSKDLRVDSDVSVTAQESVGISGNEEQTPASFAESKLLKIDLIKQYQEALVIRGKLHSCNLNLQNKLAEYFKRKKQDESDDMGRRDSNFYQQQRYLKYLEHLSTMKSQNAYREQINQFELEDIKKVYQEKKKLQRNERDKFMDYKQNVALKALFSLNRKPIPPKDIERLFMADAEKLKEISRGRLEIIRLMKRMSREEKLLRSKEKLEGGLQLIDFEQIKIENQTYNEKIEERNEELLKMRKKITSTVQILTHLKEKLQHVQYENVEQKDLLMASEASLARAREILTRTKRARDVLRHDNTRLRLSCGFLGNESLLVDFEERKEEGKALKAKLETLKTRLALLNVRREHVERKIKEASQQLT